MQVVQPATTKEIAELLRSAQAKGTRVAVRGGRTLEQILPAEGAAPDLLFDMSRMNRIESIEKGNLLARVEAGTITAAVQAAVEAEGLFYPPDPTSLETSTIGGNIACAATGPRQLKYGGTRDFVLGLEAIREHQNRRFRLAIRSGTSVRPRSHRRCRCSSAVRHRSARIADRRANKPSRGGMDQSSSLVKAL